MPREPQCKISTTARATRSTSHTSRTPKEKELRGITRTKGWGSKKENYEEYIPDGNRSVDPGWSPDHLP